MRSIGIIGGGIGGVATAAALYRLGISATVYERRTELKEAGAGMMMWPNATRIIRKLGLLDAVIERSGINRNFLVRSSRGRILMNLPLGAFDTPALCVRRSDLLSILLSAVPRDSIRLGRDLTELEQTGSCVRLGFADGSTAQHDAIVAADGIRSNVRTRLFGGNQLIHRGYTVWRGVSPYRGDSIRSGENSETWGRGSRFGILDIGHGRFTWYATANGPRRAGGNPHDELASFAAWHDPIPKLIENAELILVNDAHDLSPLKRWTVGRVTLLGDAAHACTPNLGQGGCMALEDAMVLAKCLAGPWPLPSALLRYEALRKRRTRGVQYRSLMMGRIGQWQSRVMVAGRGIVTSLLPAGPFERNLRRVYSYEA
jgi:2-polyprenyl-6-methoxyphenol hydroxylase-like FAD-dependent oxidoreductase